MTDESARDGPAGGTGEVRARLRVLATTDLHFHLLPWDYYADRPVAASGLAQAARLIRSLRRGDVTSILVDNGDFLQGSLLSDWLAGEGRDEAAPHPMIAAMNALGYDAGTLGNHDFNYGLPHLSRALEEAAFPVVSANVSIPGEPGERRQVPPWAVLARRVRGTDGALRPLRVGVIGFAPPQLKLWEEAHLDARVDTRDVVEAARAEVPRLRAAGAEVVVALCHGGIGPEAHEPLMENAAVPLAAVPGIDAVVAGHTHMVFPGEGVTRTDAVDPDRGLLHGKPAVQAGFFGSHVGVIDLDLRLGPSGWAVAPGPPGRAAGGRAERVARRAGPDGPFAQAPVDDEVARIAMPSHLRLVEAARRPVGRTEVALQSYFSLVAPDATLWAVADAQLAEGRRLLRGRPEADLPLLAAVAPLKSGGRAGPRHYIDVPPGPLLLRQAADLCIYPNTLCVVEVDGAGLVEWLERSAALFCRLLPGVAGQRLLDPAVPSYNFDVVDGLSYAIDPTRAPRTDADGRLRDPGARRVLDLRHDGRPVAPQDRFALVTNAYRVGAGGGFAAASAARVVARGDATVRDLVLAGLREAPLNPRPRPGWRLAALPGTTAWFDSGPGALAHLGAPGGPPVTPEGPAPEGFMRFALSL